MKYLSAYIMLIKYTKSCKNMSFQMLFKKRGHLDFIFLIHVCCGMMFHAFGAAAPKRLAESLKIEFGICNLVSCEDRRVREGL